MTIKILSSLLFTVLATAFLANDPDWNVSKFEKYTFFYTSSDDKNQEEYIETIEAGIRKVEAFFGNKFKDMFNIYIHPDRKSLDSAWQKDWNMPDFKSGCWMVASGVALRIDIISPKAWDKEACEHKYSESLKTQQIITHELVHVFHGQLNKSPDFSDIEGIDWFIEGLAVYASGQCDSVRIGEINEAITKKDIPVSLDGFWTGRLKYGLSGSLVMYIDHHYGRAKLKELLPFNKKTEILQYLKITEEDLLNEWANYMHNSK